MPKTIAVFRHPQVKFDDARKQRFLNLYAEMGLKKKAAVAAGVVFQTVQNHLESDSEFRDAFDECKLMLDDRIEAEVMRRGIEGVQGRAIVGRDSEGNATILGFETNYSDACLLALAKRNIPAYRDKMHVDTNVHGGVLLVPMPMTEEEWVEAGSKMKSPSLPLTEPLMKEVNPRPPGVVR